MQPILVIYPLNDTLSQIRKFFTMLEDDLKSLLGGHITRYDISALKEAVTTIARSSNLLVKLIIPESGGYSDRLVSQEFSDRSKQLGKSLTSIYIIQCLLPVLTQETLVGGIGQFLKGKELRELIDMVFRHNSLLIRI
jgi:hypothetical protein